VKGAEFDGFRWDADKSERCDQERGFNFDYAARVFDDGFIEWEDRRRDYGEQRYVAVGKVEGQVLAVVWTPRETMRRIISARPASRSERERLHGREAQRQRDS
jgi:uncharacterized DUF497 family protein